MKTSWEEQSENISKFLGHKIRQLRATKGMTQGDLAEKLTERTGKAFKVATVSRLEAGTRPTPLTEIYLLAEILEIPTTFLLPPKSIEDRILAPIAIQLELIEEELRLAESKVRNSQREFAFAKEVVIATQLLVDTQKRIKTPSLEEFRTAVRKFVNFSYSRWADQFNPLILLEIFDIPENDSKIITEIYLDEVNSLIQDPFNESGPSFVDSFSEIVAKQWGLNDS